MSELGPTATERLRALLTERGVEYELTAWSCGAAVWWRDSSGTTWRAHDNEEDELLSFYAYNSVTPEQAIAATLGTTDAKPTQAESLVALTAEQVRDAVMLADRWEKPMGNTGLTNTHLIIRDDGWQAIADELNNTLGSSNCSNDCTNSERTGTCRAISMRERDKRPYLHDELVCSECGCQLAHELGHVWQRYCPNCGRRVVDDG